MKDDVKKRFEAAIAKFAALEAAAAEAEAKRVSERQEFEVASRRAVETVIVPALKEIAQDVLEPAGWTCNVQRGDSEVTLEVYRGDMMVEATSRRPHISFLQDRESLRMKIYSATQSQRGSSESYPSEAITTEVVQHEAAKFFEELTRGW